MYQIHLKPYWYLYQSSQSTNLYPIHSTIWVYYLKESVGTYTSTIPSFSLSYSWILCTSYYFLTYISVTQVFLFLLVIMSFQLVFHYFGLLSSMHTFPIFCIAEALDFLIFPSYFGPRYVSVYVTLLRPLTHILFHYLLNILVYSLTFHVFILSFIFLYLE